MWLLMLSGCAWLFEVPEQWTEEEREALKQAPAPYVPKPTRMRTPGGGVTTGKLPQPGQRVDASGTGRPRTVIKPVTSSSLVEGAKPIKNSRGIEIRLGGSKTGTRLGTKPGSDGTVRSGLERSEGEDE